MEWRALLDSNQSASALLVRLHSTDGKLNAGFLRPLEEDASALLGEHYAKLVAQ